MARLAVEQPDWEPATHARFPPRFRQAVRELLLCVHRASKVVVEGGAGGQGTGPGSSAALVLQRALGGLPSDPLLRVLGAAAYPLSAWM